MNKLKNSASKEDYLETIYEFLHQNTPYKAVDIAKKLGVSRASVSEALQKLAEQQYIVYEKYKPAILTEKGLTVAKNVLLKHQVLFGFFKDFLKLEEDDAQINACRIEHVITDSAFKKIKNIVENQNICK